MADVKISELTSAASLDGTEIVPIVQSGSTVKTTAQDIANLGGGGSSYTEVSGTLAAGNTSITLSDASITTSSTIDIYTSPTAVNYTSATVTTGQIVIVYPAQASAITVKVRIS